MDFFSPVSGVKTESHDLQQLKISQDPPFFPPWIWTPGSVVR